MDFMKLAKERFSVRKFMDKPVEDVSIVATHMMLAAWELGIGSCWVNYFAPSGIVKAFNLPDNEQLVLLLPLGYAAEGATPAPLHDAYHDLKEMVQYL